jgi:hypothetical protein
MLSKKREFSNQMAQPVDKLVHRGSPRCAAGSTTDRAMLKHRRALPTQRMRQMTAQVPGVSPGDIRRNPHGRANGGGTAPLG